MNDFEKTQPHYLKEYSKTIEEYLTIGRPVSEPVLKYDEKAAAPDYIVMSDQGLEILKEFFPLANITGTPEKAQKKN